jgi:hypothetical protein
MSGQEFADDFGLEQEMAQAGLRALTAAIEAGLTRPERGWETEDHMQASAEIREAGVRSHITVAALAVRHATDEFETYKERWGFDLSRDRETAESVTALAQAVHALVFTVFPHGEEAA